MEDYKLTIAAGGYTVSGRVFNDNNLDGVATANSGLKNVTMVLYDIHTNQCRSVRTDAAGNYRFLNVLPDMPNDYVIYEAANEAVPTPELCPPVARDPNGYQSLSSNSRNISVIDAAVTGIDFADVAKPSLLYSHEKSSAPNSTVFYAHLFKAKAKGRVSFSVMEVAPVHAADWQKSLYYDQDCDAQVDTTETVLTAAVNVNAGDKVCLLMKVLTPANGAAHESQRLILQSQFSYGDGTTGIPDTLQTQTDITTLSASAAANAQSLALIKSVWNVSRNASGETATPGETLRYSIVYSNIGNNALDEVTVYDTVPNFTQLVAGSLLCDDTPSGLGCNPSSQGIDLKWLITGALPAGVQGKVSYQVTVD